VLTEAGPLRSARVKRYLTRFQEHLRPYAKERSVRDFHARIADMPAAVLGAQVPGVQSR
jgi:hypothetical protein